MSCQNTTNHFWNLMDNNQKKNKGWNGANQYTTNNLSSGIITPLQASLVALFNGCCRGVTNQTVRKLLNNVLCLGKESDSESYCNTIFICFNIALHCRDCRGGKGEKDASRYLLCELFIHFPETTLAIIHLIPEYGYWKDYNLFIADCDNNPKYNKLVDKIYNIMYQQIMDDNNTLDKQKQSDKKLDISLLAKWIPKEGRSMDRKYGITNRLAQLAFPEIYNKNKSTALKKWRMIVSRLNKTINTVEILMSSGDFHLIQFRLVPGRVTNICKRAFLNLKGGKNSNSESPRSNSPRRITGRNNMLSHITDTINDRKSMKGKALHLHEIVRSMLLLDGNQHVVNNNLSSEEKDLLQCQWNDHRKSIFTSIKQGLDSSYPESNSIFDPKGVIMIDQSASMMHGHTPILAANAIGIMLTEICAEFGGKHLGNRFLTFNTSPEWVILPEKASLYEKLNIASKTLWDGSTNFLDAHNMILEICIKHNLIPKDLPKWFMVLSDMQFDEANQSSITKGNIIDIYCDKDILNTNNATHHEILVSAYKNVGLHVCGIPYTLPYTYYWNLNGNINGCPVQADTPNTMMLSGFSTEMITLLFSGRITELNNNSDSDNQANSWDLLVAAIETKNKDGTFRYTPLHNILKECDEISTDNIIPSNKKDLNLNIDTTYHKTLWTPVDVGIWVKTVLNNKVDNTTLKAIYDNIVINDVDGILMDNIVQSRDYISLSELCIKSKLHQQKIILEWNK